MNKLQVSYLKKRIEALRDEKLAAIDSQTQKQRYDIKRLSSDAKLDLIYAGKVELRPRKTLEKSRWSSDVDLFDFSKQDGNMEDAPSMEEFQIAFVEG